MKLESFLGYEENQVLKENPSSEENSRVVPLLCCGENINHSVKICA
jgi:hypothetical protein